MGTTNQIVYDITAGFISDSDGTHSNAGFSGYYWSGTSYDSESTYLMCFNNGHTFTYYNNRNYGFSVRCVSK